MSVSLDSRTDKYTGAHIRLVVWDWESDESGDVSEETSAAVAGLLRRVVTVPDSGDTQPSDQYDIELQDEQGVDLLGGSGANRSNSSAEQIIPDPAVAVGSRLTLVVSNAGDTKGGTVYAYIG